MNLHPERFGPVPKIAWISIEVLAADPRYQRSIESRGSQANIKHIAEQFSWALFGAATVVEVEDGYSVIDGQHRIEAARRLGISDVPCLVVEADSVAAQARLFVAANKNRVALTPLAIHAAMVTAEDPKALGVKAACDAAGVEILPYPVQVSLMKKGGQTLAIGALNAAYKQHGGDALEQALKLIMVHWPEIGGVRAERIKALTHLVSRLRADDVGKAITELTPEKIDRQAAMAGEMQRSKHEVITQLISGMIRPEPTVSEPPAAASRGPDDGTHLTAPVNRRCQSCRMIFKTRLLHKVICDGCEERGVALA